MEWNKNNVIALFIKEQRKRFKMTQEDFALKSGLGLRFIRELEQGKQTLRLDKVNQALLYFGHQVGVIKEIKE